VWEESPLLFMQFGSPQDLILPILSLNILWRQRMSNGEVWGVCTYNTREFGRIDGLIYEDWEKDS